MSDGEPLEEVVPEPDAPRRRGLAVPIAIVVLTFVFAELVAAVAILEGRKVLARRAARPHVQLALERSRAHDRKGALAELDEAIRLAPDAGLYRYRGTTRAAAGDRAGAIEDFTAALDLDPRDTAALIERALSYEAQRKHPQALADYDAAIAIKPDLARAYALRSYARARAEDAAGALADAERAVQLAPGESLSFEARASMRERAGDLAGASADLDRALDLTPRSGLARARRGFLRLLRGDVGGAHADYEMDTRLRPEHARAHLDLGIVRALEGDRDGAIESLAKAVALAPDDVYGPLWLAGVGGPRDPLERVADSKKWPAPIVRFYLGKLSQEELLAEAKRAPAPKEQNEHLCEATTFAALEAEHAGDPARARALYEASIATGITNYYESAWARVRLGQLK